MKNKIYLLIGAVFLIIISILWIQNNRNKKELFQVRQENKIRLLKTDSLVSLNDSLQRKLVADTLTQKEINRLSKEITELRGRKPIIVQKIVAKVTDTIKVTDKVSIKKDSVFIEDYYPNKQKPFLKYTNRFSLRDSTGISSFKFNSLELSAVIVQRSDGIFEADIKTPDYIKISKIDIQTLPLEQVKKDKFGILFGAGIGKGLNNSPNFININSYLRFNKFYIGVEANSNNSILGGIKVEF